MNNRGQDGYIALAVCIATAVCFSWIVQAVQILQDLDSTATNTLTIIAGTAGQIAMAMAMLCAVIIGRNMVTTAAAKATFEPEPEFDNDGSV